MIKRLINYMLDNRDRQRISICLSKGAAMMSARNIDLTNPTTWEFSGFSQNGEDGILDILRKQLKQKNYYFVEIGSADGIDNNTAWLLIAEKYNGLMVEGNPKLSIRSKRMVTNYSIGAESVNMFVSKDNIVNLKNMAAHQDPDVFSLDIDGNDYYIAEEIFKAGFRPKIFAVEYNSVFGPEKKTTIEYIKDFTFSAHESQLYYGVSVEGWKSFFAKKGYSFITVDRNGVNAFFVDTALFDKSFLENISSLGFAENQYQLKKFEKPSSEQFKLIEHLKFVDIS